MVANLCADDPVKGTDATGAAELYSLRGAVRHPDDSGNRSVQSAIPPLGYTPWPYLCPETARWLLDHGFCERSVRSTSRGQIRVIVTRGIEYSHLISSDAFPGATATSPAA